ncbi:hypothetical protein [Amycolatopsis nigrescens]|uniref:hypothetical protein n=1 Tax=Amycolatopsis nigrescens TaxID=381445 RepID=UPI0003775465|nr:hypothetical protein [Amycolatopsis nigrescens]
MRWQNKLERRERLDELTARTRYEVRLFLNGAAPGSAYDEIADIFVLGHGECAELFEHARRLPGWERILLGRYARRIYGKATLDTVRDVPLERTAVAGRFPDGHDPVHAFRDAIAGLAPASGDTGARYDLQGRGQLTVFRLALGKAGEQWPDRVDVATISARTVLTCSDRFLRRKPWHLLWPVYRVRGLRLWKL